MRIVRQGDTLHYPIESFRSFHPEIQYGGNRPSLSTLENYDWKVLEDDPKPTSNSQIVERGPVEWRAETPYWTWITRDPTPAELENIRQTKLDDLANRRYIAEEAGTMLGTTPIATDRISQGKIHAAYTKAKEDANYVISNWKVAKGTFITLDSPTLISIGDAVTNHVQLCFDNEAALSTQILAATNLTELNAVDIESGWPT